MTAQSAKSGTSTDRIVNPFLGVLLDTDMPALMFQPMKMMALSQIHGTALINRRMQAYAAWPHQVMTMRSSTDLLRANVRFFQTALRDYAQAMEHMAEAWTGALEDPAPPKEPGQHRRDYLALSSDEDEAQRADDEVILPRSSSEVSGARACAA